MSQAPIIQASKWKHHTGVIHLVTSVTKDEVSTWSDPVNVVGIGGYSWLGDHAKFREEFQPA